MITRIDYFTAPDGTRRDVKYAADMTPMIEENAEVTVSKANLLMARYVQSTGDTRARKVNSGWRPPSVNASTPNASATSRHMTAEAIDIEDSDAKLDAWLMSAVGEAVLIELGLWHEHPLNSDGTPATPGWAHCQSVPTRSGARHFHAR
jgi:hypothetical protein